MRKPRIGILTSRTGNSFTESPYFRRLIRAGERLGATVFLFSPPDAMFATRQVKGYIPSETGWKRRIFAWPDVVIDRYRYSPTPAFSAYVAFRQKQGFLYANNRLANKWKVHEVLWKDERMRRWLPETIRYSRTGMITMIKRHPILYIKPSNGTGGRNILCWRKSGQQIHLLGRTKQREKVQSTHASLSQALARVDRWVNKGMFVIQQGLSLDLLPNRSIDMRLLIQKNERGEWSVTGYGMRVGGAKSATANLHGGGTAMPAATFLKRHFTEEKTSEILAEAKQLAQQTAQTIEAHFGRMMELGLDIGVDVAGRVWLIEVNPKPGRELFREMGARKQYQQAIARPLQYALYLVSQKENRAS